MSSERTDREKVIILLDRGNKRETQCKGSCGTTSHQCGAAIAVQNQEKGGKATNCSHLKKGKCAFPAT